MPSMSKNNEKINKQNLHIYMGRRKGSYRE